MLQLGKIQKENVQEHQREELWGLLNSFDSGCKQMLWKSYETLNDFFKEIYGFDIAQRRGQKFKKHFIKCVLILHTEDERSLKNTLQSVYGARNLFEPLAKETEG